MILRNKITIIVKFQRDGPRLLTAAVLPSLRDGNGECLLKLPSGQFDGAWNFHRCLTEQAFPNAQLTFFASLVHESLGEICFAECVLEQAEDVGECNIMVLTLRLAFMDRQGVPGPKAANQRPDQATKPPVQNASANQ